MSATRWEEAPLEALIDHLILRYHAPLRPDLSTVTGLAEKVHAAHGQQDPRLSAVRELVGELAADLLPHLDEEERVVFPWMLRRGPPPAAPLDELLREHEATVRILGELARTTDGYRAVVGASRVWARLWETLARVDRELREHIALETEVLIPRVATGRDPAP